MKYQNAEYKQVMFRVISLKIHALAINYSINILIHHNFGEFFNDNDKYAHYNLETSDNDEVPLINEHIF